MRVKFILISSIKHSQFLEDQLALVFEKKNG